MTADGRARAAQMWEQQRLRDAGVAGVEYEPVILADPTAIGPTLTDLAGDGWTPVLMDIADGHFVFIVARNTYPTREVS